MYTLRVLPRILSFLIPLSVYAALALTAYGIYQQRRKLDRWAAFLALGAFIASLAARPDQHLLFFDEDIYIQIASNLSHAPVAQLTLFGGPGEIESSTYYKEPAGFPVLLSLLFLITGTHELVAFIFSRLLYALAVAAVYLVGRELLRTRAQAVASAIAFAATPACFAFSSSTGTDLPAALFAALAVLGIVSGEGALTAGALAMTAQVRLEMMILAVLIGLAHQVSRNWKIIAGALLLPEIVHIIWVFSIASKLAEAEHVRTAFAATFIPENFTANLKYLFDPRTFPIAVALLAIAAIVSRRHRSLPAKSPAILLVWFVTLFAVYVVFYAGSFNINPRYSIQLTIPIILAAASFSGRTLAIAAMIITAVLPTLRPWPIPTYVQALAMDHRTATEFAQNVGPNDVVITGDPEVFLNQGKHAMNTRFGTEHADRIRHLAEKFGQVFYYSGIRTNEIGSEEWEAERKVKSDFELHLIDAREFAGFRIAIYELLDLVHRERR